MSKKNKQAAAETEAAAKKDKKGKKAKADKKAAKKGKIFGSPIRNLIVTTLVSVLLGVAFLVKPYEVSQYCGYGVGGLVALVGIVYIAIYFFHKPVSGEYRSEFAIGLLALLAGAYVALSGLISGGTGVGYVLIVRIIGVLIIADGLLKIQYAVDIARMKFKGWWAALIFAVLSVAVGVLTVTDFSTAARNATSPSSMLYNIGGSMGLGGSGQYAAFYGGMKMLGIGFIVNGVLDLAMLIVIIIRNRKAAKDEAIEEAAAMMAAAKEEENADFFPADATSADGSDAPIEEVVFVVNEPEKASEPEPDPVPEPEVILTPEPAIELTAKAVSDAAKPAEPTLPEPVAATPVDGE